MVKTQFMSLWDGLLTDPHCQVMVMGATNRPTDLDAAILRRLPAMFHIKLPVNQIFQPLLIRSFISDFFIDVQFYTIFLLI